MRKLVTLEEVTRRLGLSAREVERMLSRSCLRATPVRGVPHYHRDDVVRALESELGELATARLSEMGMATAQSSGLDPSGMLVAPMVDACGAHLGVAANTRPSMLRRLAGLACDTGRVYDEALLLRLLEEREERSSTATVERVAFPHPLSDERLYLEDDVLLLARPTRPIPFGASTGVLTSLFFLLAFRDPEAHLHVLARLARMLRDGLVEELIAAEADEDALDALSRAESVVLDRNG